MPLRPADRKAPPNGLSPGHPSCSAGHADGAKSGERALAVHDHELLRCVGRGAYGEVWLARNALGAFRAVKVIYRQDLEQNRPFEREFNGIQRFEPISRSHPGLVHILQVGRRDDYFYYVMELADDQQSLNSQIGNPKESRYSQAEASSGAEPLRSLDLYTPRTLREDLRQRGRLPATRCLEIAQALALALGYLHQQGLVHRDIKPSNIIFVKGAPKLADIGLVTQAGDSQSIVGTEGYLPPEGSWHTTGRHFQPRQSPLRDQHRPGPPPFSRPAARFEGLAGRPGRAGVERGGSKGMRGRGGPTLRFDP